jgi:pimeloyl-ACP methyl ester carboxylesterase
MIFSYFQVAEAGDYMKHLIGAIDIIGFSRGARSAYELAAAYPNISIRRMITIGSFHTVTSSFGNGTRPPLKNVGEHRNYIESHQQPPDFNKNPINISLGPTIHYESVKKVLDILEKEETCQ